MIKIENIEVSNFEGAFRGLRNPKNSWHLSDSKFGVESEEVIWGIADTMVEKYLKEGTVTHDKIETWLYNNGLNIALPHGKHCGTYAFIGPKDLNLAQKMIGAGSDESKFMRQIFVSMDITAPMFWWAEHDTYKVATVRDSCSKMHTIHVKPFEIDDFTHGGIDEVDYARESLEHILEVCEKLRQDFNRTHEKRYWRALIELLPEGFNMRATWTGNYQNLRGQYFARRFHKVFEWRVYCEMIEQLPYGLDLICYKKEEKNESN